MHHRFAFRLAPFSLALVAATFFAAPGPAYACGGFFCQSVPVVQSGEQIVYAIGADGSLTMSVRIYYEGAAPEFAWILPVPVTPTLSLGTTLLFDGLDNATRPAFYVGEQRTEGTCRTEPRCEFPPRPDTGPSWFADAAAQDAAAVASDAPGPVIYAEASLGPFETVVIGGASATEIHDWLTAQGYDLPVAAVPLLDDYVTMGQRFVALRLRTDASVSEIQPITLSGLGVVAPCLPIRLTAIATTLDLPITAFFLADRRATPRNYSLIETPHPATLFLGTVTYDQWVSNEADDLGGHAFIADYADVTPAVTVPSLPDIADLSTATTAADVVSALFSRGYMGDPQLLALLTRYIVPPSGSSASDYFNCLARGGGCGDPVSFDPAGLVMAIEETIREPRLAAQAMIDDHRYTTRLYTTMSAEEMTLDPEFVLDDGLPDVSNLHSATEVVECDAEHFFQDAARRLELPSGEVAPLRPATPSLSDAAYCAGRGGWLPGMRPPVMDAGPSADTGTAMPGGGGSCSAGAGRNGVLQIVSVVLLIAALVARRR